MKERHKAVPAVYLFLLRSEKPFCSPAEILLQLRANTGYQDGNWIVPSGHVEAGELPKQALVREVKEEIGIDIREKDLILVHTSYRPEHDETGARIDLFFKCWDWRGEIQNAEPHKCAELRWFHITGGLPENLTPHVRHAIVKGEQHYTYSELGVEWLKERNLYMLAEQP